MAREAERLDVDRLHDVRIARQRDIVGRETIAPQLIIVADQSLELGDWAAEPGISVGQIPEMHVGIDDRSGVHGVRGYSIRTGVCGARYQPSPPDFSVTYVADRSLLRRDDIDSEERPLRSCRKLSD